MEAFYNSIAVYKLTCVVTVVVEKKLDDGVTTELEYRTMEKKGTKDELCGKQCFLFDDIVPVTSATFYIYHSHNSHLVGTMQIEKYTGTIEAPVYTGMIRSYNVPIELFLPVFMEL